jgi:hypothetical protein
MESAKMNKTKTNKEDIKTMDYASFISEAKRNLGLLELALNDKSYKEANEHAINLYVETKLLTKIAKELKNGAPHMVV